MHLEGAAPHLLMLRKVITIQALHACHFAHALVQLALNSPADASLMKRLQEIAINKIAATVFDTIFTKSQLINAILKLIEVFNLTFLF